mmetsp:Transcript_53879/g.105372  ORF Transcript_53879/g.105372 Transcript_53879/m.105372 type:complete len:135 (-) Transcript_53879:408-812(-)
MQSLRENSARRCRAGVGVKIDERQAGEQRGANNWSVKRILPFTLHSVCMFFFVSFLEESSSPAVLRLFFTFSALFLLVRESEKGTQSSPQSSVFFSLSPSLSAFFQCRFSFCITFFLPPRKPGQPRLTKTQVIL